MNLIESILRLVRAVWRGRKPDPSAVARITVNPKVAAIGLPSDRTPEPVSVEVAVNTHTASSSAIDDMASSTAAPLDSSAEWEATLHHTVPAHLPCDEGDRKVAVQRLFDLCENLSGPVASSLKQFVVLVPDWRTMRFGFARVLLRHLHWAACSGRKPSVHFQRVRNHLRNCRNWPAGVALNWANAEAAALGADAGRAVGSRDWSHANHGRNQHRELRHEAG